MLKMNLKAKCKKVVATFTCVAMLFSFTACSSHMFGGENGNKKDDPDKYSDVQKEFEQYLDDYYKECVTEDTLSYNYSVKDGASMGLEEPEVTLGDFDMSEEGIAKDKAEFDQWFNDLKAFNRNDLTENQQLTYDIIYEYFETEELSYLNIYLYEPFAPMRGIQANLPTNFTDYRFDDKGDVERYIQLINMTRDYFGKCIEFEKTKSEKGYFMSDGVCDQVIEQCNDFIEDKDNHFMISVFDTNIDALDFLTDDEKTEFKKQNKEAVLNSLIPAYEDTKKCMEELKGTGKNDEGICNYEGGKDYYVYLLKHFTGTSKTPEEVIDMLDSQYQALMTELYMTLMSDMSAYEYFSEHYDDLFSAADNMTATEVIDKLMEVATEHYPDFDKIQYKADYLDKSLETIMDSTLAYYMSPAYDDQDNNLIRVNGAHADGMWTTLAHEGYPGHMLQNAYFMSTNPEPVRTLYNFLGYMEGWAMYACYDAVDYYEFDEEAEPYAKTLATVYKLNDEISYLVMGRIDLGINYEGWSIQDTADYMDENGFDGSAAEELYYTMVGDPAVYQSYSTGYYELKELYDYAEKQLGSEFDVKEFNTVVLETGPCQYDILKTQIEEYIDENKKTK
ncbi:MAG: DUF885 domain-containing protein [Coprococcus sp.]